MRQQVEIARRIVSVVFVVTGLLFASNGRGQTEEVDRLAEPTESDRSELMEDAPAFGADETRRALNSAIEERRAFRQTRRQAAREGGNRAQQDVRQGVARLRSTNEKANFEVAPESTNSTDTAVALVQPRKEPVAPEKPAAAALTDIKISFRPDSGHAKGSKIDKELEFQSGYSGVQEGDVTLEAKVEGRDAKGLPVTVKASWNPADPSTVDVFPAESSIVKITVRGPGQSNLTVTGPGFSKDLWISATAHEGKAIQVEISQ